MTTGTNRQAESAQRTPLSIGLATSSNRPAQARGAPAIRPETRRWRQSTSTASHGNQGLEPLEPAQRGMVDHPRNPEQADRRQDPSRPFRARETPPAPRAGRPENATARRRPTAPARRAGQAACQETGWNPASIHFLAAVFLGGGVTFLPRLSLGGPCPSCGSSPRFDVVRMRRRQGGRHQHAGIVRIFHEGGAARHLHRAVFVAHQADAARPPPNRKSRRGARHRSRTPNGRSGRARFGAARGRPRPGPAPGAGAKKRITRPSS